MNKKAFTYIINPNAGRRNGKIEAAVKKALTPEDEIQYTAGPGDAYRISTECAKSNKIAVAVGGDGTVNEVAKAAVEHNGIMGIVPAGSGNGFARHFKIPQKPVKALAFLSAAKVKTVDTAVAGNRFFIMLAGLGFDAHVAEKMAQKQKRGLRAYVQIVLSLWFKRKPFHVKIEHDNGVEEHSVFSAVAANTSQFGNNVYIAPEANAEDGLLNLTIIKPFTTAAAPRVVMEVSGKVKKPEYVKRIQTQKAVIHSNETLLNIDGESETTSMPLEIKCVPKSLKLLC